MDDVWVVEGGGRCHYSLHLQPVHLPYIMGVCCSVPSLSPLPRQETLQAMKEGGHGVYCVGGALMESPNGHPPPAPTPHPSPSTPYRACRCRIFFCHLTVSCRCAVPWNAQTRRRCLVTTWMTTGVCPHLEPKAAGVPRVGCIARRPSVAFQRHPRWALPAPSVPCIAPTLLLSLLQLRSLHCLACTVMQCCACVVRLLVMVKE